MFQRPTYRLLDAFRLHGLDLSLGTLTDGLKQLEPLFTPLYDALVGHSQEQTFWHADETRWQVFVTVEGNAGHRWYLWVFPAADVVVFVLSPTRGRETPDAHYGDDAEGTRVVDRYSADKAMAAVQSGTLVLAFCWAHVRRDFLRVRKGRPEHTAWADGWVARIGRLYHRSDERRNATPSRRPFRGPGRRPTSGCETTSRPCGPNVTTSWPTPSCHPPKGKSCRV
ncbi:Mobile element protein [Fimbriiglobus ruber]|uniref:Mobile element protein n=1 Tax=Fimbriiglobus ruber TaxID=1908690 RepID=A0A225DAY3_9BACT|nr:Mobile element protein [Fimbriiglobus ruber]